MPTSSAITIGSSEGCCPGFVDTSPFWEKDVHDAEKMSALCKLFSPADEQLSLVCCSAVDRSPRSLAM
jgi:hypothetical protein